MSVPNTDGDEEFARRLQLQQLVGVSHLQEPIPEGPTLRLQEPIAFTNPTDMLVNKMMVYVMIGLAVIQLIPSLIVMALSWNDTASCSEDMQNNFRLFIVGSIARVVSYAAISVLIFNVRAAFLQPGLSNEDRQELTLRFIKFMNFRNFLELASLLWFVFGNYWILGNDETCGAAMRTPIAKMALALLIFHYVQICIPCIIALVCLPLFCLCLPLIHVTLRALNINPEQVLPLDPRSPKGASEDLLAAIPAQAFEDYKRARRQSSEDSDEGSQLLGEDLAMSCSICLCDFEADDLVKELPCRHLFHGEELDEWLRKNASCPICRASLLPSAGEGGLEEKEGESIQGEEDEEEGDEEEGRRGRLRRSFGLPTAYAPVSGSDPSTSYEMQQRDPFTPTI